MNPNFNPDSHASDLPSAAEPSSSLLRYLYRWLPVVIWAALIFIFSAQSNPYSVLPSSWPENWYDLLGAILHFLEYTLLAFLLARALVWRSPLIETVLLAAFLLAALYGLSDEVHQLFVPGRAFQVLDLALDWIGSLFGIGLYLIFYARWKRV